MDYQEFRDLFRKGDFDSAEEFLNLNRSPENQYYDVSEAFLLFIRGENDKAIELASEFYDQSLKLKNPKEVLFTGHVLIHLYNEVGKLDEVLELSNKLIQLYENSGSGDNETYLVMSYIYNTKGNVIFRKGRFEEALEAYTTSLSFRVRLEDQYLLAQTFGNIANIYNQSGKYVQAEEYYSKALNAFEEGGFEYESRISYNNRGVVNLDQGRLEEAEINLLKSIEISKKFDDDLLISFGYNNLGLVEKSKGNLIKALDYFSKAYNIRKDFGTPFQLAYSYYYLIQVYLDLSQIFEAKQLLTKLKELSENEEDNQTIKNQYYLSNALILKKSSRQSQRFKSKQLFENIYHDNSIYEVEFKITAIFKLCDFLLEELIETKNDENEEEEEDIINEIKQYVNEMESFISENDLVVNIQLKFLKSYLALSELEFDEANELIEEAEKLAAENGINYFAIKAPDHDYDEVENRSSQFIAGDIETNMAINKIIHSLPKLKIIFYLYDKDFVSFVELKDELGFTPGNLGKQCSQLAEIGYIEKTKQLDENSKFITVFRITPTGIAEFKKYADHLKSQFQITEIV